MNHSSSLIGRILALASFVLVFTIAFGDLVASAEECLGTGTDIGPGACEPNPCN